MICRVKPTPRNDQPPPSPRNFQIAVAAVVLVALALRLIHLAEIRRIGFFDSPVSDGAVYIERARGIAEGDLRGPADFVHAPLYAYFLGAIMVVAGPEPWWTLRIFQVALGSLACGLLAVASRHWFSARTAIIAAILLALCPAAIFYDGLIQKTSLEIFLTASMLACMAWAERRASLPRFLAVGAIVGLLSLTRQHTVAIVPFILLWAWRCKPVSIRPPMAATACLAAFIAMTGPWIIRNRAVLGEFALGTPNMGQNFVMGNHADATGTYFAFRRGFASGEDEQSEWTRAAEQAEGRRLTPREVSDHYLNKALAWIRQNPGAWLRLTLRKWLMVWNSYEASDTEDFYIYAEYSTTLRIFDRLLHFGVLAPLAAAGIILTLPRWRQLWFLYAWLFISAAATAAFVVFARYRAVLLPVVCIFAAVAIAELIALLRRRQPFARLDAVALAVVLLTAIAANWTIYLRRRPHAMSYCNLVTALARTGRHADALTQAERALALAPDDVDANVAAGDALVELHRFPEALDRYRRAAAGDSTFARAITGQGSALAGMNRLPEAEQAHRAALKIDPKDRVARQGLATAAARQGRLAEAEKMFRELLGDEPRYAEAWINLGNTYQALNRPDDAVAAYERAVAVRPRSANAWFNLGVLEARRGRAPRATECFGQVLQIDPNRADARDAMNSLRSSPSPTTRP